MDNVALGFAGWKITRKSSDVEQIEARKRFGDADLLLVVGKEQTGFNHRYRTAKPDAWGRSTKGKDFLMSANGGLCLTLSDLEEINTVVRRAKLALASNGSLA